MRAPLKALAALLLYPDTELRPLMPELAGILCAAGLHEAAAVADSIAASAPLEAEAAYVETFDRSPQLSLHLFEHVHGDSRDRGSAMAALVDDYRAAGLELTDAELPDFLPVFLEFAALRPEAEARALLGEVADVLALLEGRLARRGSPYATVLRALQRLASRPADGEAIAARLAEDKPDDTPEALDASWEEVAVTFMQPAGAGDAECHKAAEMVARMNR